jgi:hypothetical protein
VRHGLSDNDEAVGENVALDVALLSKHIPIVTHGGASTRAASEETAKTYSLLRKVGQVLCRKN